MRYAQCRGRAEYPRNARTAPVRFRTVHGRQRLITGRRVPCPHYSCMQLRQHCTRHKARPLTSAQCVSQYQPQSLQIGQSITANGACTIAFSPKRFLLGRTFFCYVRAVRSFVGLNVLELTVRVAHCIEFVPETLRCVVHLPAMLAPSFLAVQRMRRAWKIRPRIQASSQTPTLCSSGSSDNIRGET